MSNIFRRVYSNGFECFINNITGKAIYCKYTLNCLPLTVGGRNDFKLDLRFSTFDIECYTNDKKIFVPYACGFLLPFSLKPKLYYLSDYDDHNKMIRACLFDMLDLNIRTVYVHNLSRFDSFFINNILLTDPDFDTVYKFNKLSSILSINVKFKDKRNKNMIIFRDSLLLVQGKLKDLAKSFNTNTLKLNFPHSFVSKDTINYIGFKPDFKFYEDVNIDDYNKISNP